jgi:hypothetical protein
MLLFAAFGGGKGEEVSEDTERAGRGDPRRRVLEPSCHPAAPGRPQGIAPTIDEGTPSSIVV